MSHWIAINSTSTGAHVVGYGSTSEAASYAAGGATVTQVLEVSAQVVVLVQELGLPAPCTALGLGLTSEGSWFTVPGHSAP